MKAKLRDWAGKRLREPSTWFGIIGGACAVVGWNLDLAERDALAGALAAVLSAVLVFTREDKTPPSK